MIASEPGTRRAPAAPWSSDHEEFECRRDAAQERDDPEPDQADDEDPSPAVFVGHGSGDDQEGGQDGQVPAVDVGLALEDPEASRRQLLADPL
jgi:hypothetical protein